jgi:hypothetical protein
MFMRNRQNFTAPYPRQRRYRRFDLEFPVHLSFPSAGTACELHTVSRNVSIGGLLLKANNPLPTQTQVSLTIEVKGPRLRRSVRLQASSLAYAVAHFASSRLPVVASNVVFLRSSISVAL